MDVKPLTIVTVPIPLSASVPDIALATNSTIPIVTGVSK